MSSDLTEAEIGELWDDLETDDRTVFLLSREKLTRLLLSLKQERGGKAEALEEAKGEAPERDLLRKAMAALECYADPTSAAASAYVDDLIDNIRRSLSPKDKNDEQQQ